LLYAAPEGGNGTKGDMYSLGILLFEMFYKFATKMERVIVLEQVRATSRFPQEFEKAEKYAAARRVIRWLLHRNPDDRPSAMELANSRILPTGAPSEAKKKKKKSTIATKPITLQMRYKTLMLTK